MTRFFSCFLFIAALVLACPGCGGRPEVVEEPETYEPDAIEEEMNSEEYEKAMSEMGQ